MDKFYITTPLYYVNSKPHIGHSYTQIACDALARFMRQSGRDVFFMTGTDEHGEKIEKASEERGFEKGQEKRFVDEIVPAFKELWEKLRIRYDLFIRTTDSYHVESVQAVLEKLFKDGKIYKKAYKGWFCTPCETFWSETQSPGGICPDCKRQADKLDEENYFLKISEYQRWLMDYIDAHPAFIKPDFRRNEVMGFLKETLLDLCISRPRSRMSWGIEIPFDKNFVTYVWFDALLNYISGAGYPHDKERFDRLWPCDVHVIGKDILRHHAVYWPIILHMLDIEMPGMIFAHGWWISKGEKMSKSKGNVVDPAQLTARYGVDPYRYFLLREVPFGLDGAFSEEMLVRRYNSDLANDLGNLLNRTLTMVEKYFDGKIPRNQRPETRNQGNRRVEELKTAALGLAAHLERHMPRLEFSEALSKIWEVVNAANKFIEDSKPWRLAKENKTEELSGVIRALLEVLRIAAISVHPFMPSTAGSIYGQLGLKGDLEGIPLYEIKKPAGEVERVTIGMKVPLFPRIESS